MTALFYLTLVAELALGLSLAVSIIKPARRIWPTPGWQSWQFWFVWILIIFALASLGVLALSDWNSFIFPDGLRHFIGLPLFVGGLVLAFSGVGRLGAYNSAGLKGKLMTGGVYRYSRNPQYLGDIISLVGLVLFSNATFMLLPGLLGALLFALWPFSEEPWLRERFGEAYERYCERVPRFFSFKEI